MLTPFGIAARDLRNRRNLRLLDLAERLQKTSAFLSAVETGRKPIPPSLCDEIANALDLDASERQQLVAAADRTRKEVPVSQLSGGNRELIAAFARNVGTDAYTPDQLEQIRKLIFKMTANREPFSDRRRGYLVPPRSALSIWDYADTVRSVFLQPDVIEFPIMHVLEFQMQAFIPGFHLDVRIHAEMDGDEGRVFPGQAKIELREDVYERACGGEGRSRFTACHELGHFLMHSNLPLSRMESSRDFPVFRDAEWQADSFAGALLVSRRHIDAHEDADDAASNCGVSAHAARVMFSKYGRAA